MITRVRLATRHPAVGPDTFAARWADAVAAAAAAPTAPLRVVAATTLTEVCGADPRHDGVALESFADDAHLAAFEAWLASPAGVAAMTAIGELLDESTSPVLVADEHVLRGADWLAAHRRAGRPALVHMALARRAPELSAAELSERWRSHAGRLGRPGAEVVIPDEVRGRAYAQLHPRPHPEGGEWAYDAVNEVWFDDVDGLRARHEWFLANLGDGADDLVAQSWFLGLRAVGVAPA